jgi:Ca2+-binding EF-hand superfamily protein
LLFARYDEDRDGRINYKKFCKMIMPTDSKAASRLMNRISTRDHISYETQEVFKRLLRAHLNVEQAHEYLRERFTKKVAAEGWQLEDIFSAVNDANTLSIYDIERLIIEYKKSGSRTLIEDVELLFAMYDKSGSGRINLFDFRDQLVPLIN